MKIRELIEKLKEMDQDSEVTFLKDEFFSIANGGVEKKHRATEAQAGEDNNSREYGEFEQDSDGYDSD